MKIEDVEKEDFVEERKTFFPIYRRIFFSMEILFLTFHFLSLEFGKTNCLGS